MQAQEKDTKVTCKHLGWCAQIKTTLTSTYTGTSLTEKINLSALKYNPRMTSVSEKGDKR